MNKGLIFSLGVILGITGGGVVANTILKQKYAQKADDEISACREAFLGELAKLRKESEEKKAEETKNKAAEALEKYGAQPEEAKKVVKESEKPKAKEPYEIPDEVFEDPNTPYPAKGLTYFPGDGVLLRPDHTIMDKEDIEEAIGLKALSLFDDDRDRVCIRNEKFGCDYEIIPSPISYAEWKRHQPKEK